MPPPMMATSNISLGYEEHRCLVEHILDDENTARDRDKPLGIILSLFHQRVDAQHEGQRVQNDHFNVRDHMFSSVFIRIAHAWHFAHCVLHLMVK